MMPSGLLHLYAVPLSVLALLACGGGDLILPTDGSPGGGTGTVPSASTSTLSADPASIEVGTGLSTIRVTIRDPAGAPVPDATVTLSASGSGNTVTQPTGPTGGDGVAIGTLSSDVPGTKDVVATVNGAVQLSQTAQVFVAIAPATRIELVDGNNQNARSGTEVPVRPAVRVTNASGEPIVGYGVTFLVTRGGGTVTGASQTTNSEGVARVGGWTLGSPGRNTLEVRAGSLTGSPVVFEATATSEPPPPPPPPVGEPHHFVFRVPPRDVDKREWFTIEVAIMDVNGNVVPLNGTEIYVSLWPQGSDVPANKRLAGDRFEDTRNGIAVFRLYVKKDGHYRFLARSDYLPKHLGPYGPELFSNTFEVD
jgi:Bacterial Ig-like domain (group 1)